MKSKLAFLLVACGVFGSVDVAKLYVSTLDSSDAIQMIESLENDAIIKSPKVALSTMGHDKLNEEDSLDSTDSKFS